MASKPGRARRTMHRLPLLILALASGTRGLADDLWVSDFSSLSDSEAAGAWYSLADFGTTPFEVRLRQHGGSIRPMDGSATQSTIVDSYGWNDSVAPAGYANFDPTFIGDFINVETAEDNTTTVVLEFGAEITNPILYFSELEYRTTLRFTDPFNVRESSENLAREGLTLTSSHALSLRYFARREAAGSIEFPGTFSRLTFTIEVEPGDGVRDVGGPSDLVGFAVATENEPVEIPPVPVLEIEVSGDVLTLSWEADTLSEIEYLGPAGGWLPLPGPDPASDTSWIGSIEQLGPSRIFRGVSAN